MVRPASADLKQPRVGGAFTFLCFCGADLDGRETSITELQGSNALLPFTRLLGVRLSSSDLPAGTMLGWS